MKNENETIFEFDFNLICEYFSYIKRQGPGSPESTIKALCFIDNLTTESKIADLGCGTGGQTMVLAQNTQGIVTGIDLFPNFIGLFNENASRLNLQDRAKGIVGSMDNLDFQSEELDLIWSEGAIYNIGFERGINEWHKYLKKGGYIAVTEAVWFTNDRPKEIEKFWMDAYPEINTIPAKLEQMQKASYVPIASFTLPENCWIENFYIPQVEVQKMFLNKYPDNKKAIELVDYMKYEYELYSKFKEYYGYAFFIAKKR